MNKNSMNKKGPDSAKVKLLDAIMDFSFDGLWISDGRGKILKINKASEKINGVKAKDVVGKNVRELVKRGFFDKSVTLEVIEKKSSVTVLQKVKNGKTILVTGNPIFNKEGDMELVVVNERDITYLDEIRNKLRESEILTEKYKFELSLMQLKDAQEDIVFRSKAMESVIQTVFRVCKVECCVLLLGESGVGKSLIAKLIHKYSPRNNGPFMCISCGAIPESLMESELFGYEKGAFTGANEGGKPGILELANKGTVFLDEIDELPLHLQPKLLHFLEEKEILRVGGTKYKKIDARVIAATNKDLEGLVKEKKFRKDLFFRLNVVPIYIPPLRERPEDIPYLILFFLNKYNKKYKKKVSISPDAVDTLLKYQFPGNVRELANLIERLTVLMEDGEIKPRDLPEYVRASTNTFFSTQKEEFSLKEMVERLECSLIKKAIEKYGSQRKAAESLGVDQSTISRKMKKYGIEI